MLTAAVAVNQVQRWRVQGYQKLKDMRRLKLHPDDVHSRLLFISNLENRIWLSRLA